MADPGRQGQPCDSSLAPSRGPGSGLGAKFGGAGNLDWSWGPDLLTTAPASSFPSATQHLAQVLFLKTLVDSARNVGTRRGKATWRWERPGEPEGGLCSGLAGRHASTPGCSSQFVASLSPRDHLPPTPNNCAIYSSVHKPRWSHLISQVAMRYMSSGGLHSVVVQRRQVAYLSSQLSEVVSLESFVGFFMISRPHLGKTRARVSGWGSSQGSRLRDGDLHGGRFTGKRS